MKYLTKGDFLTLLGDKSNNFTLFMLKPEEFNVQEPLLTSIKIAYQKFSWTNGVDFGLEEVQGLLYILKMYNIITDTELEKINNIPDLPDYDSIIINIIAQDDIVSENIYGAEYDGNYYHVRVDFKNITKNTTMSHTFLFDTMPTSELLLPEIQLKLKELKNMSNN